MKKITTRKFEDGKMKTMKELTGSYRGYEYKLKIIGYSISNRKVDKAEENDLCLIWFINVDTLD